MGCQPLTVGGLRPKSCWGWLGVLLGVFGVKTPDGWGFDPKRVWGTPNGWGLEVSTISHHNRPQSAPTIKPGALCVGYGCSARVHGLGLTGIAGTTLHRYRLIKHTSFTAIVALTLDNRKTPGLSQRICQEALELQQPIRPPVPPPLPPRGSMWCTDGGA